jgi:hypothetical protein
MKSKKCKNRDSESKKKDTNKRSVDELKKMIRDL